MSVSRNGMHGWPSGKLGNVVSYMLNGQLVHRTVGKQGKPSLKQKANHQSMAVITRFLGHFNGYLSNGFELEARGTIRNQHNLAVSCNKKNALQGNYPNISIDYAKVQLSKGTLKNPENLRMEKVEGGLQITWDPSYQSGEGSQYDDCLQLAIYFPKSRTQKVELNFSKRELGTAFLPLEPEKLEGSMEVYLFLSAANHDSVSDTVYLGNLNGAFVNPEIIKKGAANEEVQAEELRTKARYEQVSVQYKAQMKLKPEDRISAKAFRNLEREYLVLANRFGSMPTKSG
ncbi:DUF6266 family protein [Pedobacter sp. PLR]|uniref:DUF6266 family protein n=1 Tax=Pedobacter sp. PLR TaxID=2994465 RepID=UPI0022476E80|nr:DUF6266 family protein [Pedobacter sp. PLR]MCX2450515.1 DUF6266 family protein [Pedobacter sp. PLR]